MGDLIRYDFVKKRPITAANDPAVIPTTAADILNHEKFVYFEELLARGKVSVQLLTGGRGVEVPDFLRKEPMVVLDWSLRFGLPDFEFDDVSIRGTLSFNHEPFYVVIPWESVRKIHLTNAPKEQMEWGPPEPRMQQTQQIIVATHAQLAALLGNLPPNFKPITAPEAIEEINEPTTENPPAVAPNFVKRVFGKIRGGFGAVFGK